MVKILKTYLVQFFSKPLIHFKKDFSTNLYKKAGYEMIKTMVYSGLVKENEILSDVQICNRPEFGQNYKNGGCIFIHGLFILQTSSDPFALKKMLAVMENLFNDNKVERIFDIDLYEIEPGHEKKISYKGFKDYIALRNLAEQMDAYITLDLKIIKQEISHYLHFEHSNCDFIADKKWIINYKDWEIIKRIYGSQLITISDAILVSSRTNLVRKCVVDCFNDRHYLYIKELFDYPISNTNVFIEPARKRLTRMVNGNKAFCQTNTKSECLLIAELLHYCHDLSIVVEKDCKTPYLHGIKNNIFMTEKDYYGVIKDFAFIHGTTKGKQEAIFPVENEDKEVEFCMKQVSFRLDIIKSKWNYLKSINLGFEQPEIQDFVSLMVETRDILVQEQGSLCHGDLVCNNLIKVSDKYVLTDFDFVCYHDPAFDLGFLAGDIMYHLSLYNSEHLWDRILNLINVYIDVFKTMTENEFSVAVKRRTILYTKLFYYYRYSQFLLNDFEDINIE